MKLLKYIKQYRERRLQMKVIKLLFKNSNYNNKANTTFFGFGRITGYINMNIVPIDTSVIISYDSNRSELGFSSWANEYITGIVSSHPNRLVTGIRCNGRLRYIRNDKVEYITLNQS